MCKYIYIYIHVCMLYAQRREKDRRGNISTLNSAYHYSNTGYTNIVMYLGLPRFKFGYNRSKLAGRVNTINN